LLAILKDGNNLAATVLEENNIDYKSVFEQLSMKASPNAGMGFTEDDDEEEDEMNMSSRSSQSGSSQSSTQTASKKPSNDTPVLDNFGMDMTRAAEEGRLDPVVGREREIERLAQILSRRKKNNPVLIGEPGVGKSAIVEGLALRIVQKKVSRILFDKRVVMLEYGFCSRPELSIAASLRNVFVLSLMSYRRIRTLFCLLTRFTRLWVPEQLPVLWMLPIC